MHKFAAGHETHVEKQNVKPQMQSQPHDSWSVRRTCWAVCFNAVPHFAKEDLQGFISSVNYYLYLLFIRWTLWTHSSHKMLIHSWRSLLLMQYVTRQRSPSVWQQLLASLNLNITDNWYLKRLTNAAFTCSPRAPSARTEMKTNMKHCL